MTCVGVEYGKGRASQQRAGWTGDCTAAIAPGRRTDTYVGTHDLVGLNRAVVVGRHSLRSRRMVMANSDFLLSVDDGLGCGQKLPSSITRVRKNFLRCHLTECAGAQRNVTRSVSGTRGAHRKAEASLLESGTCWQGMTLEFSARLKNFIRPSPGTGCQKCQHAGLHRTY